MTFDISPAVVAVVSLGINAITGMMMAWISFKHASMRRVLNEVERQGNSVSLELKRTNMVYSRRLAEETKKSADIAIADDAQKVYEEAQWSAMRKQYPVT